MSEVDTTTITQLPLSPKDVMLLLGKLPQESADYLPMNKTNYYMIWWKGFKPDWKVAAVVLCVKRHQLNFPYRKISYIWV